MVVFAAVFRLQAATVSVGWDPSPDAATGKVLGYKFYYSTASFTSIPADAATNPAFTILNVTTGTSLDLPNLIIGQTYYMAVTAFSLDQESDPSNIVAYTVPTQPANLAVSITSPSSAITVASDAQITIGASATGSNPIAKIEFFDGGVLIVTKTAAPYSFVRAFTVGAHILTAKATDTFNNTATSAPVTITVTPPPNVPPTVALTSPANNAQFSAGQSVTVSASAADSDGTISRIDFFDGATLIGTRSAVPYSISLSSLSSGSHTFTAKAVDNAGATTTSTPVTITVNPPANVPPTVALTSPGNNAQFTAGQTVTISATAADSDGSISGVDFFDGATLIGSRLAPPYSIAVSSLSPGSHTLTAKAADNTGAATTSAPVTITVNSPANVPPTVALTSPGNNAQFTAGQTVIISATAADSDGTISRVDFFDGATLIGAKSSAPFSMTISTLSQGAHILTAKAVDNSGAASASAPVAININPDPTANSLPVVSISSLNDGAVLSQPVALTASATDADGSIVSVEFFANDTSLGSVTSAPFSVSVPLLSGTYVFKARATDNAGGSSFSAPITANVKPAPPVGFAIK